MRAHLGVCAAVVLVVSGALLGLGGCRRAGTARDTRTRRLVSDLRDPRPDVRIAAADALGRIGHKPATRPLIRALYDVREDVRCAAARALGRIGSPDAVDPLSRLLKAPQWAARKAAAEALGAIASPAAVPHLARAMRDPNPAVAAVAAAGLLNTGEAGTSALLDALADPAPSARRAAVYALGQGGRLEARSQM